ncbi:hypothetical protein [Tenacibaculum maritimum]|uniref:hypothetical protein n=1 Tax=Tenacibaculum maritimum TaxID=107401 RepID=UPI00388FC862
MRKINLSGKLSHKEPIKKKVDQPQSLVFNDVSLDASIATTLDRYGERNTDCIVKIPIVGLLEIQQKIGYYSGGAIRPFVISKTADTKGTEHLTVDLAHINVCLGGELYLGDDDTFHVDLDGLKSIDSSKFRIQGGARTSMNPFIIQKEVYRKDDKEKSVDLFANEFICFSKDNLPSEIEFIFDKEGTPQKLVFEPSEILEQQAQIFGQVAFDSSNRNQIFGTHSMVVIRTSGISSIYLKDYRDEREDLEYYTFSFNS